MTQARYQDLEARHDAQLTEDEWRRGWHWCASFDGLLVGHGLGELNHCHCLTFDHPVYKTAPKETTELLEAF
jgi:hypothetical protein